MRFLAHFLAALGVGRLALLMARAFGDRPLPSPGTTPHEHEWGFDEILSVRQKARYYGFANLVRGSLYIPVLWGLAEVGSWVIFGLIAALVAFHLVCMVIEIYRWATACVLPASSHPVPYKKPRVILSDPEPSLYFVPKFFESDRFYRSLGFETIRKLVDTYVQWTELTPEERRTGKKVKYLDPSRQGLLEFEADTRQAEGMHLAAAMLNVPPLISLALHGSVWAWWNLPIFVIDTLLVILQRYHRTRVWKVLMRTRKPAETAESAVPDIAAANG